MLSSLPSATAGSLATASIRTGAGPYDLAAASVICSWRDSGFVPFQPVPTFAAKQSSAVTDYASQQLIAHGNVPAAVTVPGLDGEDYPA
jgi:hypothetical protein